jgi:hypothetical protein
MIRNCQSCKKSIKGFGTRICTYLQSASLGPATRYLRMLTGTTRDREALLNAVHRGLTRHNARNGAREIE